MSEHLDTLAIHGGTAPDPTTKARVTPIYQTASYVFDDVDHAARLFNLEEFGNIYSRLMNPTNDVLEKKIAALEGGVAALAVGSGHAAQFLAFHTLMEPGCHIVAANKLYGGSLNQIGHSFKKFGWTSTFVDADDPANIAAAITDKTRCIFIESLANPGGVVQDIALHGIAIQRVLAFRAQLLHGLDVHFDNDHLDAVILQNARQSLTDRAIADNDGAIRHVALGRYAREILGLGRWG